MPPAAAKPPISPLAAEFGRRVRERRHELGLSQEALAATADLHWTYIGQVERGQRNISLHNIVRVADALEVDVGVLVTGMTERS